MPTEMVSPNGTSIIHHDGDTIRPDKRGVFLVPDNAVNSLRPHGLITFAEARAAELAKQNRIADEDDEARADALEKKLELTSKTISGLESELAAAKERIAELEAQIAVSAKGEGK